MLSIKRTKLSMWRGCFQLAISSNEILRHVINKLFVSTPCSFPFKLVMYSQLWQKVSNWTHLADFDTQSFQRISEQSKIIPLRVELQWYQLCLNKELKTSDWNLKKKINKIKEKKRRKNSICPDLSTGRSNWEHHFSNGECHLTDWWLSTIYSTLI